MSQESPRGSLDWMHLTTGVCRKRHQTVRQVLLTQGPSQADTRQAHFF